MGYAAVGAGAVSAVIVGALRSRPSRSYKARAAPIATPRRIADGPPGRLCHDRAGFADIVLPADEYLNLYILPNFYFHFGMAYAIARSQGAPLGKGDFDGSHSYAPGFSFERPAAP